MKYVAFAIALYAAILVSTHAHGSEITTTGKIGDMVTHYNWCRDVEAARALADGIEDRGDEAYVEVMNSQTQCYDARLHGPQAGPITVMLKEYLWVALHTDGTVYEFWYAADSAGNVGVIWLVADDRLAKPPGQPS
jgi:hypothetical protein